MRTIVIILFLSLLAIPATFAQKSKKNKKEKTEINAKEIISLNPLQDNNLKVGQKASFSYIVHASVGSSADIDFKEDGLLEKVSEERKFLNKSEDPHASGDDKSSVTIVVKALKAGKTSIIQKNMFRGDLKSTDTYTINITE